MRVLGNRIVVRIRTMKQKSDGGIYLPSNANKLQLEADVVYVGDEAKNFKVDDHVIVDLHAGIKFKDDLTMFDVDDVLAKVEEE